eukprot:406274_1
MLAFRQRNQRLPDENHDQVHSESSILDQILNGAFYSWIFKFVSMKTVDFEYLPDLPPTSTTHVAYANWQRIFRQQKHQNKSTSTTSMIYHTERYEIIKIIILVIVAYMNLLIVYMIFTTYLWPSFNSTDIINISKYTLIIFFFFTAKSILSSRVMYIIALLRIRVEACLWRNVYEKTLMLHLCENDKQKILNIVGSDIVNINQGLDHLLRAGAPMFLMIIVSFIILYYVVGISSLFGIGFMLFIGIPFQLYGGYKLSYYSDLRMNYSDQRVQLITELIRGIRVLKLSAYEIPSMHRINQYRQHELNHISRRNFWLSLIVLSNFVIPAVMVLVTLMVYCLFFKHEIDTNVTLFILMLFTFIQIIVKAFPIIIGSVVSYLVSCNRIDAFLAKKTVDAIKPDKYDHKCNDEAIAVQIENGKFAWSTNKIMNRAFCLNNIDVRIKRGKLVAIIGSVGCGKTSLFQSILGEMNCIDGKISVNLDEIVYCSQTPYIRNVTLRENIILELPFNEIIYKKCIVASALQFDLEKLPNSDNTLIGDEGVTISGGQKMRIAYARTLYRKAFNGKNNIYLFDDPLSCVDVYVGKQMFFNGIFKYLMNRNNNNDNDYDESGDKTTCLMVINSHLHLVKFFDEIIIMDGGEIKAHNTVNELFFDEKYNELLTKYQHLLPNTLQINTNDVEYVANDEKQDVDIECIKSNSKMQVSNYDENECNPDWKSFIKFMKSSLIKFDYERIWFDEREKKEASNNGKQLMLILPILISIVVQCLAPFCDVWILYWHQQIKKNNMNIDDSTSFGWYFSIWCVLLSIIGFATVLTMHLLGKMVLKGADHTHCKSLYNLLRANVLFFDLQPRGSLLSRFTKDTSMMDVNFSVHLYRFILWNSSLIGYTVIVIVFIPYSAFLILLILLPMLLFVNYKWESTYFSCLLMMNHFQSTILTLFAETVPNLDSIRSYKLQTYFIDDLEQRIDNYMKPTYLCECSFIWLTLYQEILFIVLQTSVIMMAGFLLLFNPEWGNKECIALACWYLFGLQQQITYASADYVYSKRYFVSIMRLMRYHDLFDENKNLGKEMVHEASQINREYRIPKNNYKENKWPDVGKVKICKLQLKYRRKFNIVLDMEREINVFPGDKIGICGRTGSGKSSILVSIFRLFEPLKNNTMIDNLTICNLGLYDLRQNLSIIPQMPVLFNGSLRFNLDPFDKYTDDEIWDALRDVELFNLINSRENKLECWVHENGSNFSIGQKQLICFARSILSKPKLLFMDEATAQIDKYTDVIIQKLIRSTKFKNVTVFCIAHRLQTIIDYDYILLLQNGKVKQYDTPSNLLSDKNGDFLKLVNTHKLYHNDLNNE